MNAFEQPSPDAPSKGLQLSSRQIAIGNLLEKLNPKLVPIYLGAMETLQSKPADFMALAAHGFREVMEKTTYWTGGKRPIGMKEKFNADFGKIWSKVRAAHDKGNIMRYPNLIRRFIRCFSDFATWVEESIPSRALQAESALRILQKRRGDFAQISRLSRNDDECIAGYQRPEVLSHIAEIRNYLESEMPMLPNAIVVAFDSRVEFRPLGGIEPMKVRGTVTS